MNYYNLQVFHYITQSIVLIKFLPTTLIMIIKTSTTQFQLSSYQDICLHNVLLLYSESK